MSGKRSRTKGHSFERWTADKFRSVYPNAKRKLEYQISECTGVDISDTGPFKIQCKAYKDYAPISKIKEIQEGGIPCLVTKGDRKEAMIVLPLTDFINILKDIGVAYEGCKIDTAIHGKEKERHL